MIAMSTVKCERQPGHEVSYIQGCHRLQQYKGRTAAPKKSKFECANRAIYAHPKIRMFEQDDLLQRKVIALSFDGIRGSLSPRT